MIEYVVQKRNVNPGTATCSELNGEGSVACQNRLQSLRMESKRTIKLMCAFKVGLCVLQCSDASVSTTNNCKVPNDTTSHEVKTPTYYQSFSTVEGGGLNLDSSSYMYLAFVMAPSSLGKVPVSRRSWSPLHASSRCQMFRYHCILYPATEEQRLHELQTQRWTSSLIVLLLGCLLKSGARVMMTLVMGPWRVWYTSCFPTWWFTGPQDILSVKLLIKCRCEI